MSTPTNSIDALRDKLFYEKSQMADVLHMAVVSTDGGLVVSTLPNNVDLENLRKGIDVFHLSKSLLSAFDAGGFFQTFIRGDNGYLIISNINPSTILIVSTTGTVKLALMLQDLKLAAMDISSFLSKI